MNNENYKTHFSGEGVQCDEPQDNGADMFAILDELKNFVFDNFGENIVLQAAVANNYSDTASVTFEDEASRKAYTIQISRATMYRYGGVVDVE